MSRKNKKLVVAIETDPKAAKKLLKASKTIEAIARQGGYSPQPVSVISPDQVSWPSHFSTTWAEQFLKSGSEAIAKTAGKLGITFKSPVRVIPQTYNSRKLSAKAMADFVQNERASMLAIVTHVNPKNRFLPFGGFAETTMALAEVPVLAVSAIAAPLKNFQTILLATEFWDESKVAFLKTLEVAKALGCRVRLFHAILSPVGPSTAFSSPMVPTSFEIAAYLEEDEARLRKIAKSWVDLAKAEGVEVEVVFDKGLGSVSSRVLRACAGKGKNRADIVAIAPQIGSLGALFFGSTTRDILRKSKIPVLLIHAGENVKEKKDDKNQRSEDRQSNGDKPHHDRIVGAT
jgi:nucleotide-binding universal stress UspA family protein